MKYKTSVLKSVLTTLKTAIDKKDVSTQLGCVILSHGFIFAYNGVTMVSFPFDWDDGTIAINALDFNNIVSGISDKEIQLSVEQDTLKIRSDNTKAEIALLLDSTNVEDIYYSFDWETFDWIDLPDNFVTALAMTQSSMAKKAQAIYAVDCVSVQGDTICASDGFRFTQYMLSEGMPEFLIPYSGVKNLIKYPDIKQYHVDRNWAHFLDVNEVVISCRLVRGTFPDVQEIIQNFQSNRVIPLDKTMIPILKKMGKITDETTDFLKFVRITIKPGETTIKSSKIGASITQRCANDLTVPELTFVISPIFLIEILDKVTEIAVGDHHALFEYDDFLHFVSLPILDNNK